MASGLVLQRRSHYDHRIRKTNLSILPWHRWLSNQRCRARTRKATAPAPRSW